MRVLDSYVGPTREPGQRTASFHVRRCAGTRPRRLTRCRSETAYEPASIRAASADGRYTRSMRVVVASVLLFLLATIACVDPLCCSDGCDRGGLATTHSTQTGANCPTCLSAVVPHHEPPIMRTELVAQVREPIAAAAISPFRTDVDHPPRLA
jgi:hypothetical protein